MIRTFIIDDHPMVIAGIQSLLAGSAVVEISGAATDGQHALEALLHSDAEVALTDINLGDMNGIELCSMLKKAKPGLKILGLSTFKERSYITRMLEAGASGYLLKNATREELEEGITTAWRGRMFMSAEVTEVMTSPAAKSSPIPLLTAREKEVLALIAEGLTNQEIATQLFVSPLTVDSHRKNLLAKFEVKNTAQMVKVALEHHLL
ncbi:MAG: response regulator transcription factor [Saprospiraceae bacterium]|nr:response regulator transcription factor [Saprospiraceae bacterium]